MLSELSTRIVMFDMRDVRVSARGMLVLLNGRHRDSYRSYSDVKTER
jgi:hypothetical protein